MFSQLQLMKVQNLRQLRNLFVKRCILVFQLDSDFILNLEPLEVKGFHLLFSLDHGCDAFSRADIIFIHLFKIKFTILFDHLGHGFTRYSQILIIYFLISFLTCFFNLFLLDNFLRISIQINGFIRTNDQRFISNIFHCDILFLRRFHLFFD